MSTDPLFEASESQPISDYVNQSIDAIASIALQREVLRDAVHHAWECVQRGGTIFWCGNGGSAADAQHLAAELIGRFEADRAPLRSIALTSDTAVLTALANDYSYESVFSRQVEALVRPGDVLFALSTSGSSPNVVAAVIAAKAAGAVTVAMTGMSPSRCGAESDLCLRVSSAVTSHVQEAHIVMGHALCRSIEMLWVKSGR